MAMVKRLRILLLVALAIGLFRWVDHSFHRIGGRSFFSKIEIPASYASVPADQHFPKEILTQHFTYLGKGSQAWVFLSEDQKYVLKFYKQHIYEPSSFLAYLPFGPWRALHLAKQKKYQRTIASTNTAFRKFREDTGLLYVHLLPTNELNLQVKLFDKQGDEHLIPLDRTAFVLQKRAELIYPHLAAFKQQNDLAGAEEALASLFSLLKKFGESGVVENDPILRKNFGFIEGRACQIDVGKMRIEPSLIGSDLYKNDLEGITASLKTWLQNNYPELLPSLDTHLGKKALGRRRALGEEMDINGRETDKKWTEMDTR
ncbi:MAG: hypothetical protein HYX48_03760 [Chlamydiales bacterium]|nr:hypothetical protein [Chlamydiales bacterium]